MSAPTPWRGALVGCGFFAENHMHAWASSPDAEIVAVCDLDARKARATGERFKIGRVYVDATQMFSSEQLDFVDIATTVGAHRQLVELGSRHARLVICQKPLAETLEDADAMVAACRDASVSLLVHENFRWQRPFLEIAQRLAAGAVGQPVFARLSFRHNYDIYRTQPYLADAGRLALMDVGLHLVDLIRFLIGDITNLHCRARRVNRAICGEDSFILSLRHADGAISVIDCSFASIQSPYPFPQTLARIEGTDGTLELSSGYLLREQHHAEVVETGVEPEVPAWGSRPWHVIQDSVAHLQRHAIDILAGRASPQPSGLHNRDTLALVLAAYESAATDQALPIIGPRDSAR